ncbi:Reverse transcriptase (RNA-dependent DNA polymerase) [Xenococcus sp. PCC 7305]|uniref:reverse transcriptase domain-containing protein n=1 Tax=Xenococcus sp. PCC 7305 TaxID=102125 RepID=UPI0002ACC93E|nr:reverse transcriptase domain-containing protein [Xenococcus sp. PCC 7305]ELS05030.1 Reverse transcriptase (RNA-dependent DNA polymerase) [Xenococcus sp. PCC 7305]
MTNHFDLFLRINNFKLAFKRLQTSQRDLYKDLYYEDTHIFGLCLDNNLESLINEIKQKIFKPQKSHKIFIPKKNNLVRPLSLLHFKDLLVYQAIINIISDSISNDIFPYYNNIIFGNYYYTSHASEKDRIFFFKPWKKQWKKFEEKTKDCYQSGYQFLSEFDIASFFDTIDHNILSQLLKKTHKIDDLLVIFLIDLLQSWTADFNHKTFIRKNGIPQGPIASAFLADLYLLHLDLEFSNNKLDLKYIRYVDDIRIFTRDDATGRRAIAYLDLLARDLGLIPQSNKITVTKINNLDEVIKHQKSKLSLITKEFKKKKGSLKAKTHKKLKRRFIDCFDKNSNEEYLDKTIIKFALYKLNHDKEIKKVILDNCEEIYIHYESILYYLRRHFYQDQEVRIWLANILTKKDILFHHVVALILKFFPDIEFIPSLYNKYMQKKHRHWLVKYYMIAWLDKNNKSELILKLNDNNYFINRELNKINYSKIKDRYYHKIFINDLLKSSDTLTSLQGLYLDFYNIAFDFLNEYDLSKANEYIKTIRSKDKVDYINHTLINKLLINDSRKFFNDGIWSDIELYNELRSVFATFFEFKEVDPSKSLLNLNLFNELIFDRICLMLPITKASQEYGVNLKSDCIQRHFPITNQYFALINDTRNQKSEAHVYDKFGNIRTKIKINELNNLINYEVIALKEICSYKFI